MARIISWFSCGVASAVATKLAIAAGDPVIVAYCEVKEESDDNIRFLRDCEKWFGQEILIIGNDKYERSIYKVFEKTRYLVGPRGARCTGELKKQVREDFQEVGDIQILGYTCEEQHRVDRFIDANNEIEFWPILIEKGLDKIDCKAIVQNAGIELPILYKMGYANNNCIPCVKGQAGYQNKVRVDFPEHFERMAQVEESLGRTICKVDMISVKKNYPDIYKNLGSPEVQNEKGGAVYWRPTLRELPPDAGDYPQEQSIECGIFCMMAEDEIKPTKGE